MSISYKMTTMLLRAMGVNKYFKDPERMAKALQKKKKEKEFVFPYSYFSSYVVEESRLRDRPLYRIRKGREKPKHSILYWFGGGFMMLPTKSDVRLIRGLIDALDVEVVLPIYPLIPHGTYREIFSFGVAAYEAVLQTHLPEEVHSLGFSAGASLSLNLFVYAKAQGEDLPYPAHMALFSPAATVPPTAEERKRMEGLDEKDVILNSHMFDLMEDMTPEELELMSPLQESLGTLPPISLLLGTREVFYGYLPTFEDYAKRHQVDIEYYMGEGMCHCWPLLTWTPEAKETFQELVQIFHKRGIPLAK